MKKKLKTLTISELCKLNDISVPQAEKALASLQSKGLVRGFVPGNLDAKINLTTAAGQYAK